MGQMWLYYYKANETLGFTPHHNILIYYLYIESLHYVSIKSGTHFLINFS